MPADMDRDLRSIQQVRDLLRQAHEASKRLRTMSQQEVDRICQAMVQAGKRETARLASMAVEDTGFGKAEDKMVKNWVCTDLLWESIREMRTAGFVRSDNARGVHEVAEPMGIVAAIIPSTNPTSTALYKTIISIKSRNAVVVSPHPSAERCIAETCRVVAEAAQAEGLPSGAIGCMRSPTLEGTQELMRHKLTSVIVATGGSGIVKAAYSSGTPAYGVGPGNVPAYVDRSADVPQAIADIVHSKTFDWGTLCSSEQAVVADAPVYDQVLAELRRQGAHFLDRTEQEQLAKVLILGGAINPKLVGRAPQKLAEAAGFSVPSETRVLVAPLEGVGPEHPLSREKLSPVLALYRVADWREGIERARQILLFHGIGHTAVIHCRDPQIIEHYAQAMPAGRVLCNTLSCHGSVGATTGLAPSMTLGCGTWGGSITADNVTPLHLVNIKRLAFGIRDPKGAVKPQPVDFRPASGGAGAAAGGQAPAAAPASGGVTDTQIKDLVARYLRSRNL
jgi:acetaldehyde dehydrogenase (acetylating)